MTPNDERELLLERAMARHHYSADALIEILHRAQELYGRLSPSLLRLVARRLKLPPSRVLGVATFYHLFRFAAPHAHTAAVCLGTACYAAGGKELLTEAERLCRNRPEWSIEAGRCLGSCGLAPILVRDGEALARVDRAHLNTILSGEVTR